MFNLVNYPSYVVITICILMFAVPAMLATYYFRKRPRIKYLRAHNEIVGYVFAILGGFYGLIMGFVVLLVWEAYNDAQNNADREGSLARCLYRDIRYYPKPEKVKTLMVVYMQYLHNVVEKEYPAMADRKVLGSENRVYFNTVFAEMERMDFKDDPIAVQMFRQLNELETYRGLRQLSSSSEIWPEIWVPLEIGAAIILFFAILIDVESKRMHIMVVGMLGAFIGLVIYMIIIMDHPFTGTIRLHPDAYQTILKMEHDYQAAHK